MQDIGGGLPMLELPHSLNTTSLLSLPSPPQQPTSADEDQGKQYQFQAYIIEDPKRDASVIDVENDWEWFQMKIDDVELIRDLRKYCPQLIKPDNDGDSGFYVRDYVSPCISGIKRLLKPCISSGWLWR
jgi:hypothetical protein